MIGTARSAIAANDYKLAAKTLDDATAHLDSESPTASELTEMAVLYMIINERMPEDGHDAAALDCYSRAASISPDSVNILFGTLPPDEAQYLFMLSSLYRSIRQPEPLPDDNNGNDDTGEIETQNF